MNWQVVIGLEIHVQLATKSKLFSGAATAFGAAPNTQACAVDLALPGVLPVLNREAVAMAVKFGLAVAGKINSPSIFARKNYFYPDLPKGYQISQFALPIVAGGHLSIELGDGQEKQIAITRAHLEEDAGKSLHEDFHDRSGIDLNRAGTPLLEIVSEPQLHSAKQAVAYAKKIHSLVRYLEICDGNMHAGSFRCDINVSLRPQGQTTLGTRAEIKNVNSFRFVEKAIEFEVQRQAGVLEDGDRVKQETRLFDAHAGVTRSMRSKEDANDYRYFPDPDLLPVFVDAQLIEQIRAQLPELPAAKKQRFMHDYHLASNDAETLTANTEMADYFEQVAKACADSKLAANWIGGTLQAALNKANKDIMASQVSAPQLAGLLVRIVDHTVSGNIAKQIFEAMWDGAGDADAIIEQKNLRQVSDDGSIEKLIDTVLAQNAAQVAQYKSGKEKLFGFFVGKIMQASKGKANPAKVNEMLLGKLKT